MPYFVVVVTAKVMLAMAFAVFEDYSPYLVFDEPTKLSVCLEHTLYLLVLSWHKLKPHPRWLIRVSTRFDLAKKRQDAKGSWEMLLVC